MESQEAAARSPSKKPVPGRPGGELGGRRGGGGWREGEGEKGEERTGRADGGKEGERRSAFQEVRGGRGFALGSREPLEGLLHPKGSALAKLLPQGRLIIT